MYTYKLFSFSGPYVSFSKEVGTMIQVKLMKAENDLIIYQYLLNYIVAGAPGCQYNVFA